ncbi:22906_t:CDS:2, partial [Cetraspora pellucida]
DMYSSHNKCKKTPIVSCLPHRYRDDPKPFTDQHTFTQRESLSLLIAEKRIGNYVSAEMIEVHSYGPYIVTYSHKNEIFRSHPKIAKGKFEPANDEADDADNDDGDNDNDNGNNDANMIINEDNNETKRVEKNNSDGLLILNDPKEPTDTKEKTPNIGIEVEKDDTKTPEWYSKRAKKSNSDGLLILNDPKEPTNAKKKALNIGIEVEKNNPKASE